MLCQFRREEHLAQDAAEAVIALCREQGFAYYRAWGTIIQGWGLTAMQQSEEGIAQMRRGIAAMQATGAQLRGPYYLALLAEACGQAGQVDAGLTMLAEGLNQARQHGEGWHEAELHRLQGELLLLVTLRDRQATRVGPHRCSQKPDAEVAQCFQQALGIARRQQARSLELRAAISLARLWQHEGNRVAAYGLLAPIYDRFTEGFDTADLQDAKALLAELG
jgi:predicted ATPase